MQLTYASHVICQHYCNICLHVMKTWIHKRIWLYSWHTQGNMHHLIEYVSGSASLLLTIRTKQATVTGICDEIHAWFISRLYCSRFYAIYGIFQNRTDPGVESVFNLEIPSLFLLYNKICRRLPIYELCVYIITDLFKTFIFIKTKISKFINPSMTYLTKNVYSSRHFSLHSNKSHMNQIKIAKSNAGLHY